jgi:hypothetical protein
MVKYQLHAAPGRERHRRRIIRIQVHGDIQHFQGATGADRVRCQDKRHGTQDQIARLQALRRSTARNLDLCGLDTRANRTARSVKGLPLE